MSDAANRTIAFDVLLRGESDDVEISAASLEKLRPSPDVIERCYRWLSGRSVTCHKTDFGLGCEASVEVFESLFGVSVTSDPSQSASPKLDGDIQIPTEIENLVSQITLVQRPTFFG